jgi:hypothetical protein
MGCRLRLFHTLPNQEKADNCPEKQSLPPRLKTEDEERVSVLISLLDALELTSFEIPTVVSANSHLSDKFLRETMPCLNAPLNMMDVIAAGKVAVLRPAGDLITPGEAVPPRRLPRARMLVVLRHNIQWPRREWQTAFRFYLGDMDFVGTIASGRVAFNAVAGVGALVTDSGLISFAGHFHNAAVPAEVPADLRFLAEGLIRLGVEPNSECARNGQFCGVELSSHEQAESLWRCRSIEEDSRSIFQQRKIFGGTNSYS